MARGYVKFAGRTESLDTERNGGRWLVCIECRDIDYRVADIWRPCYVPRARPAEPVRRAPTEDHYEAQRIIQALRHRVRELTNQVAALQAERHREARTVEPVSVAILD